MPNDRREYRCRCKDNSKKDQRRSVSEGEEGRRSCTRRFLPGGEVTLSNEKNRLFRRGQNEKTSLGVG